MSQIEMDATRRSWMVALGLGLYMSASGCGPTPAPLDCEGDACGMACEEDIDCGDAESCVSGLCEPQKSECLVTCGPDETCQGGTCRPDVECTENIECDDDQICLNEMCWYVGSCIEDEHCPGEMTCVDNACEGDPRGTPPGGPPPRPPNPCEINADCEDDQLCWDGMCLTGVECLRHLHCPANNACFVAECWDLS